PARPVVGTARQRGPGAGRPARRRGGAAAPGARPHLPGGWGWGCVGWHPEDPRSWGGWHPQDPRWGRHQPTWGWGHGRPLYDNQLGHRLPTGGPPAAGQASLAVAIGLFPLSAVPLLPRARRP